jgi:isocitrate/isopropylmalate dehydrogenase
MQAAGATLELTPFDWGADRYLADKVTVPPDGFATLARDFDAILVGAFGDPRVPSNIHAKEILLGMRSKMDLYANVRPVRLMDASLCPLKGIEPKDLDFVVIRENTEGVYGDLGGVFKQGTPTKLRSRKTSTRARGSSASSATRLSTAPEPRKLMVRPATSADVRQVECHDPRRRPVAARVQRSCRGVSARSRRSTCM